MEKPSWRGPSRALGVSKETRITSPTFTLVQEYETAHGALLHADLYRLLDDQKKLEREVENLGLRDRLREGAIAIVEWGDDAISFFGGARQVRIVLDISNEKRSARVFD